MSKRTEMSSSGTNHGNNNKYGSATKLKHASIISKDTPTSTSTSTAYTAFNAVDAIVAKPVYGSDGTMKWQKFNSSKIDGKSIKKATSMNVAPTAPLKAIDRATGFTSWQEERDYSNQIRSQQSQQQQQQDVEGGIGMYQHFTQSKGTNGNSDSTKTIISAKERKRIESRTIRSDQTYFIPSNIFRGWKFDYIFTTRKEQYGTGYYFDGMDSIKLLHGELQKDTIPQSAYDLSSWNTTKEIEELQDAKVKNDNDDEGDGKEDKNYNAFENKKRLSVTDDTVDPAVATMETSNNKIKKKKSKVVPTIINNPNHPLEQVAAIMEKYRASASLQEQSILPYCWEVAYDTNTQKQYYYNRTTSELTWDRPTTTTTIATTDGTTVTTPTQTPTAANNHNDNINLVDNTDNTKDSSNINNSDNKWKETIDPDSGRKYYYHTETGKTTWDINECI